MDQAGQHLNGNGTTSAPAWADLIDLASARLGGKAVACSDDFFASMSNLVKPERAIFVPGKFTVRGKWMDGWESRRKRSPPPQHDWCVIELGRPGTIVGVNVDTAHFNGNQPEWCVVEGAEIAGAAKAKNAKAILGSKILWTEIVSRAALKPSSEHFIAARADVLGRRFTHVRLNIFPDGGVARLRVHGRVVLDWKAIVARGKKKPHAERGGTQGQGIDLAAAVNGGLVIDASNMHFGSRHNMIMPGRAKNMGDGWETRRRRGLTWVDGRAVENDWAIVQLAHRGVIGKVEVDTNHFKGNFPESCVIEVCDAGAGVGGGGSGFDAGKVEWRTLLGRTKLRASARHVYQSQLEREVASRPWTHARLSIFPDGGISRLRLWGRPVA